MKDRKTLLIVGGIVVVLVAVLSYSFMGSADSGAVVGNRVDGGAGSAGDSTLEGGSTDQPTRTSAGKSGGASSRMDAAVAPSPDGDEADEDALEIKSKKKSTKKRKRKSRTRSEEEEEGGEEEQEQILRPSTGIPIGG